MTCSWNSWGSWSGTCGRITRQRTSKATQHVVNRPNCNGLQTSCPVPQTEFTFISCECLFYRSICTVLYKVEILYTCLSVRRFFSPSVGTTFAILTGQRLPFYLKGSQLSTIPLLFIVALSLWTTLFVVVTASSLDVYATCVFTFMHQNFRL